MTMQPFFFRYSGGLIVVTESPNFRDGIKCAVYTIISHYMKSKYAAYGQIIIQALLQNEPGSS